MTYWARVEDAFARPVPYGVLQYSDAQRQIPFTADRKREVLRLGDEIRRPRKVARSYGVGNRSVPENRVESYRLLFAPDLGLPELSVQNHFFEIVVIQVRGGSDNRIRVTLVGLVERRRFRTPKNCANLFVNATPLIVFYTMKISYAEREIRP